MRELFIYYRIRDGAEGPARAAVAAMQADLRTRYPGLAARWLTRRDEFGRATWMEIYAMQPGTGTRGIDAEVESAITALALPWASLIDGTRHIEVFESCED